MTDRCSEVNSACVVTARRRWCSHTADFIELGKAANRCRRDSMGTEARCSYAGATYGGWTASRCIVWRLSTSAAEDCFTCCEVWARRVTAAGKGTKKTS